MPKSESNLVERVALGRTANIGDLYNIEDDTFIYNKERKHCVSLFKEPGKIKEHIKIVHETNEAKTSFTLDDMFSKRLKALQIPLDQRLGIQLGLHEELPLEYDQLIKWNKSTNRHLRGTLIHTQYGSESTLDSIEVLNKDNLIMKARSGFVTKSTHLVYGVTYGKCLILSFDCPVPFESELKRVERELTGVMADVSHMLNTNEIDTSNLLIDKYSHLTIKTEVSGLVSKFSYESWNQFVEKLPEIFTNLSETDDRPLLLKLYPVNKISVYNLDKRESFHPILLEELLLIEEHFGKINQAKCNLMDFYQNHDKNVESIVRLNTSQTSEIKKLIKDSEVKVKRQMKELKFVVRKHRTNKMVGFGLYRQKVTDITKIFSDETLNDVIRKYSDVVHAHKYLTELKLRQCGIITKDNELKSIVKRNSEIYVFQYYPKSAGIFNSPEWKNNYNFFLRIFEMIKQLGKYETKTYVMECETSMLKSVGRFLSLGMISGNTVGIFHFIFGKKVSENCLENRDDTLQSDLSEYTLKTKASRIEYELISSPQPRTNFRDGSAAEKGHLSKLSPHFDENDLEQKPSRQRDTVLNMEAEDVMNNETHHRLNSGNATEFDTNDHSHHCISDNKNLNLKITLSYDKRKQSEEKYKETDVEDDTRSESSSNESDGQSCKDANDADNEGNLSSHSSKIIHNSEDVGLNEAFLKDEASIEDEFIKPCSSDDDSNRSPAEDNAVIDDVPHDDISSKPKTEERMEPDKISANTDSNISSPENKTDMPKETENIVEDTQNPTNECYEQSTSNTENIPNKTITEESMEELNKTTKNRRKKSQRKKTKKQPIEKPENESRRKPIESTSPKVSEETKYILLFENENCREHLPEDEVNDSNIICTVKRNQDYEETAEQAEEIDNFPVLKMMCPSHLYGSCRQNGVHVWTCDVCNSELRYGLNQYIYCVNCGRASAISFTFKCSHVTHGEEFFTFPREDDILAMLEKLGNREELNILILGETGVGKTTFINAFANYLTHDTLDEAERSELIGLIPSSFTLSDENYDEITVKFGETDVNESEEEGASKTQTCKCYSFPCGEKMVKLIDTPGIGDTKGIDQDAKNFVNILSFISNFSNIHGILLLMKPNNSRLNIFFRFCIQELLKHLHKSASENINFVFTNSKSTFYRPGDTFRPLKKLLSELRDVNIPLNQETIYCMDNDSFRFLVASHNNVKFTQEDLKEYTTSWKKSAKECERLLTRIAQLKPHSVKETLSINGARRLIVSLAQPLGDIIMIINENLFYINKQIEALSAGQNRIEKIQQHLFVPVVDTEVEYFNKPRTVCGSECCMTDTDGVANLAICHNPCQLSGTTPDVVENEQLLQCLVFKNGVCAECGCSWKNHMHIYYQMRKTYTKKMDSTANTKLSNWKTRQEEAEEIKYKLEEERKCYTKELDYVLKASATFTHFIAQNSLTQESDFIMKYLLALIDRETCKTQALGYDRRSANFLDELDKAINGYAREVSRLERERKDVTAQEIDVHVNMLYDLPKFGGIFKDIAQRHEQALAREVALYSERVYVPRNSAGGGKRFQFS